MLVLLLLLLLSLLLLVVLPLSDKCCSCCCWYCCCALYALYVACRRRLAGGSRGGGFATVCPAGPLPDITVATDISGMYIQGVEWAVKVICCTAAAEQQEHCAQLHVRSIVTCS